MTNLYEKFVISRFIADLRLIPSVGHKAKLIYKKIEKNLCQFLYWLRILC